MSVEVEAGGQDVAVRGEAIGQGADGDPFGVGGGGHGESPVVGKAPCWRVATSHGIDRMVEVPMRSTDISLNNVKVCVGKYFW